jgi:transcriptional regulator with XRE-family HTH domain
MHGETAENHTSLGALLRQERRSRKLSQEQVALKAGVARATLNRWEQGAHLPRLPELNAVLDALDASPLFRTQALSLIHAPRAIHTLRAEQKAFTQKVSVPEGGPEETNSENAWVFTPETGDLLRMMRLRRGMTQEYVADQVGVRRFSVSRWETGDLIPSDVHLDQVMLLLGALPEEKNALSQGILLPSQLNADTEKSFQAVHEHLIKILWEETDTRLEPLKDLEYLRLERAFADLIPYHPDARDYLVYTYSFHAQWLTTNKRYSEAAAYADRVIEAAHEQTFGIPDWQRSILTAALCAVYSSGRPRPERGVQMLQDWLPLVDEPEYEAWILSDMAKYQAQAGRIGPALETIARSCRVALRSDNPVELRMRRVDRAELLLQTEQPDDAQLALDLLPNDFVSIVGQRLREALCWSKGLLQVGEVREAKKWLERAETEVREHALDPTPIQELERLFVER